MRREEKWQLSSHGRRVDRRSIDPDKVGPDRMVCGLWTVVPNSARDCDKAVTGRKWAIRDQTSPLHFAFGLFMHCCGALCPTYGPVEE